MNAKHAFLRAAVLVSNGWCQGNSAQNQFGRSVAPTHPDAAKFCAVGALVKATKGRCTNEEQDTIFVKFADHVYGLDYATPVYQITQYNDAKGRTASEVVEALVSAAQKEAA